MDQLHGHIERITFHNPENGYTVAHLESPEHRDLICIVGNLPPLQPGETVRCFGEWKTHLVHGKQFSVNSCQPELPATLTGIEKYLGSGLINGIGPGFAKRIVETFGISTLEVIDQTPERLTEVKRLGSKRASQIASCWQDQKSIRDVMVFLQSHQVTPSLAQKIFKLHGQNSIKAVLENPYSLARAIRGIGFKSADKIASAIGISKEANERLDAGLEFTLQELSSDGHVCYPLNNLLTEAELLLEVSKELLPPRLEALKTEGRIEIFEILMDGKLVPCVWLKGLFLAEVGIAKQLMRLKKAQSSLRPVDVPRALEWVQKTLNIQLAEQQKKAVALAVSEKIEVITGGPGTGKSTITKSILAITSKLTPHILLAAPTGRAAKRMTEITGWKAQTIHSLLEFSFKEGGFKRGKDHPLDCELLIIDEASMIDTSLMYYLLRAVPNHARVILIGDICQLPSVGPGNVLRDIINSGSIPVTKLTEIFRQAAGSKITTNAHAINNGTFPDLSPDPDSDFFFVDAEEPSDVLAKLKGLISHRLPQTYRLDPLQDIQVLTPMRRGMIGTENLNSELQKILNPNKEGVFRSGSFFSLGDKVMQTRNDYDKNVFNGDIGKIVALDQTDNIATIHFDGKDVAYAFHEFDDLVLAYAISIHKSQGSECPCVIIPVHTTHFMMLHRNLLYTGVTRGKRLVILVGTKKALSIAIRNDDVKKRYTGLTQALIGMEAPHLA